MDALPINLKNKQARPLTPECPPASAWHWQAGQTIIEAIIALASILLTLSAIAIAISTSVSNSTFIGDQTRASKYAQGGMERLRYLRNSDPGGFFSKVGIYCMNEDNSFPPGSCLTVNIAGAYKREVVFTQDSLIECGGGTKVVVNVYWPSGKCGSVDTFCHKSQLISCFAHPSGSGGTP